MSASEGDALWASRGGMLATLIEQARRLVEPFSLRRPGTTPKSVLALIGFLLLCGCDPEICDKEVDRETAVQIATEYLLSRGIAYLEHGRPFEQKEAMRMRRAGMTEETYRETFQQAAPEGARRVANQWCGHPFIYWQAIKSVAYDGFDVSFWRVTPNVDIKRWRRTVTVLNITKCGRLGALFGTSTAEMSYEGRDNERMVGRSKLVRKSVIISESKLN